MDVLQSSKENMYDNEMVMVNSEIAGLQIYNNVENLVKESL